METTNTTDGVIVILVGLLGLCIFGLGIAAAVFFVFYRFAGGKYVDFFANILRGDKDDKSPPAQPETKPPQLRDMAKQSSFDNTLTQQMLNNEVRTGKAINTNYTPPYPQQPTATGTFPAQSTPYSRPAASPNMGYPAPNSGYPPPQPSSQPPPARSGYPQQPLPPPPQRDPFSGVNTSPGSTSGGLNAPQGAEWNRNQGYVPNPGDPGDDFLGPLDDDIGL